MELTLVAGPPAKLVIEGPATLSCGTRGVLPQLALRVADAGGNFCTDVGGVEVGGDWLPQSSQAGAAGLLAAYSAWEPGARWGRCYA